MGCSFLILDDHLSDSLPPVFEHFLFAPAQWAEYRAEQAEEGVTSKAAKDSYLAKLVALENRLGLGRVVGEDLCNCDECRREKEDNGCDCSECRLSDSDDDDDDEEDEDENEDEDEDMDEDDDEDAYDSEGNIDFGMSPLPPFLMPPPYGGFF